MPDISLTAHVPGDSKSVFAYVTAFPSNGNPDLRSLEDKYGSLEEQEGLTYIFRDNTSAGIRWRYTFDPPHTRETIDLDSNWSDRFDVFEPWGDGTRWTITWEPKSRGAPFLLRWLFFRWKDRERLHSEIVQPVIDHFEKQGFY